MAQRKSAMKRANAVFAFALKNAQGNTATWYIDLKETGEVGKGSAPSGKEPDGKSTQASARPRGLFSP